MKSLSVLLAAGVISASAIAPAFARDYVAYRHFPIVHARGHASGIGLWARSIARHRAIEHWRERVAVAYGPRYAHWWTATGKHVRCHFGYDHTYCHASARPSYGIASW